MSLKRLLAGVFGSMAIAGSSMFAQDASLYTELEPTTIFSGGVQYLVMRRDSQLSTTTPVIDGPDSASVAFQNTDFRYRSGIRGFLAAETAGARIEASIRTTVSGHHSSRVLYRAASCSMMGCLVRGPARIH